MRLNPIFFFYKKKENYLEKKNQTEVKFFPTLPKHISKIKRKKKYTLVLLLFADQQKVVVFSAPIPNA